MNLDEDNVGAVLLGLRQDREGDTVKRTADTSIEVGEIMLGRVIDPLGATS